MPSEKSEKTISTSDHDENDDSSEGNVMVRGISDDARKHDKSKKKKGIVKPIEKGHMNEEQACFDLFRREDFEDWSNFSESQVEKQKERTRKFSKGKKKMPTVNYKELPDIFKTKAKCPLNATFEPHTYTNRHSNEESIISGRNEKTLERASTSKEDNYRDLFPSIVIDDSEDSNEIDDVQEREDHDRRELKKFGSIDKGLFSFYKKTGVDWQTSVNVIEQTAVTSFLHVMQKDCSSKETKTKNSTISIDVLKNLPVGKEAQSIYYQEQLDQKEKTINKLKVEMQKLQEQLKGAKYRNKKLCHLLSEGEIREKAEILVQVEQLTQVRDELTQKVQQLNAELEENRLSDFSLAELKYIHRVMKGERSKVHSLQT